ncbi:MAG: outer membrane lipoprotein-sorting protein [Deltaproteobacteria bacterium]|nr:outer membrane lipoprotein-sorting protein [Deltaproteobacteria bacterium]
MRRATTSGSAPTLLALAALLCASAVGARAAADTVDAIPLDAETAKQRWHARLDSRHFTASISLEMNLGGSHETRELSVWRDDAGLDTERVMVRFESPPDLRNVALLYLEHGDQPNDYFLYQPATRRIRRLPETVANDDVYGIDLEFLGFGVAQSEPTEIESMTRERLRGRDVYRLVERATRSNSRFDRRSTWLDAETFLALRTEHERLGKIVMRAEVSEVRDVQGVPTPMKVEFHRIDSDRAVELVVRSVDYEAEIPESYFTAMALVRSRMKLDSQ